MVLQNNKRKWGFILKFTTKLRSSDPNPSDPCSSAQNSRSASVPPSGCSPPHSAPLGWTKTAPSHRAPRSPAQQDSRRRAPQPLEPSLPLLPAQSTGSRRCSSRPGTTAAASALHRRRRDRMHCVRNTYRTRSPSGCRIDPEPPWANHQPP